MAKNAIFEGGKRMKRYSSVLATLVLLLIMVGVASAQIMPPPTAPICPKPDTTASFYLQQGVYNKLPVWYFCTDTTDINFASTIQQPYRQLTLAPRLISAGGPLTLPPVATDGAAFLYINTGYQQGPIFSTIPGMATYSGIWEVAFVIWNPGSYPKALCSEADVLAAVAAGKAHLSLTYGTSFKKVILDCPIMVVGQLSNPLPTYPNPNTPYVSPQILNIYTGPGYRTVMIPAYSVYCQELIAKYIDRCRVIIPDVSNPILATKLRANYAPFLTAIDPPNRQFFSCVTGGPTGNLKAPSQLPVICQCPTGFGTNQLNLYYTPVMNLIYLNPGPNFPSFPNMQLCLVTSCNAVQTAITKGIYTATDIAVINAPVLDCQRAFPVCDP